jgi:hypothetical protein
MDDRDALLQVVSPLNREESGTKIYPGRHAGTGVDVATSGAPLTDERLASSVNAAEAENL